MFKVIFYETKAGNSPVAEWIRELDKADRRQIGFDLAQVQVGFPMGLPLCRSLGHGLWEVRSSLSGGEGRLIFCELGQYLLVLHGFMKKSRRTLDRDIKLAKRRRRKF